MQTGYANHCWVCPTKNKKEFYNPTKLVELLTKEFGNEYTFDIINVPFNFGQGWCGPDGEVGSGVDGANISIQIRNKNSDIIFKLWCYPESPSGEGEEFVNGLDKISQELGDKYLTYYHDLDLKKCIQVEHFLVPYNKKNRNMKEEEIIVNWIRQYFQALVFDEDYMNFIPPIPETEDYKPKIDRGIIKKFANFFKSK